MLGPACRRLSSVQLQNLGVQARPWYRCKLSYVSDNTGTAIARCLFHCEASFLTQIRIAGVLWVTDDVRMHTFLSCEHDVLRCVEQ